MLPSSPNSVSGCTVFCHFVHLTLFSLDNGWMSRTFDAIVAPSLVDNKDFILGTPFLTSNNIVIDFGKMTAIPASSSVDLLNPGTPCTPPSPLPKPVRMSAQEHRKVTRNLSLAMRELRAELRKIPCPEDIPSVPSACDYPFDNVIFTSPGAPTPAFALHTVEVEDDFVLIN
jgi:hypothetical protein